MGYLNRDKSKVKTHSRRGRVVNTYVRKNKKKKKGLIPLSLLGVGVATTALLLRKRNTQSISKSLILRKKIKPENRKDLVVMVVSSNGREVVKSLLHNKSSISEKQAKDLYRHTMFIWTGSDSTFKAKNLPKFFNRSSKRIRDKSEYDLYLVSVRLKDKDRRFLNSAKVDSLDRLDAYHNLSSNIKDIKISRRVTPEELDTMNNKYEGFYKR